MRRARAPIRMKTSGLISWWMNVRGPLEGAIPQRPRRDLLRVRVVLPDPEDVHLRVGHHREPARLRYRRLGSEDLGAQAGRLLQALVEGLHGDVVHPGPRLRHGALHQAAIDPACLCGGALRIRRDRLDYPIPLYLRRSADVPVEELPIEAGEVLRVIPVDLEMRNRIGHADSSSGPLD